MVQREVTWRELQTTQDAKRYVSVRDCPCGRREIPVTDVRVGEGHVQVRIAASEWLDAETLAYTGIAFLENVPHPNGVIPATAGSIVLSADGYLWERDQLGNWYQQGVTWTEVRSHDSMQVLVDEECPIAMFARINGAYYEVTNG